MIPQEEMTATADRLTDALTAAAAIMPPDEANALSSPAPGRPASPASRPVRRRMGRLRAWLVPVGVAAIVTAIIVTAVTLAGHPGSVPAPGKGPAQAPASAGPGITSLAGVPSDPGTRTPPPPFYVTIVSMGITRDGRELMTVQVRRTSDGHVTATVPALPAGWILGRSVSVTADDRTFTVAASTMTACPSSTATRTRFYQFTVTSTGHVTGLRVVGKPVIGDIGQRVRRVTGWHQGRVRAAGLRRGGLGGLVRGRHPRHEPVQRRRPQLAQHRVRRHPGPGHDPDRGVVLDGQRPHPGRRLSVETDGRTGRPGCPWPGRDQLWRFTASSQPPAVQPARPLHRLRVHRAHQLRRIHPDRSSGEFCAAAAPAPRDAPVPHECAAALPGHRAAQRHLVPLGRSGTAHPTKGDLYQCFPPTARPSTGSS